jgi:hypothetical protein
VDILVRIVYFKDIESGFSEDGGYYGFVVPVRGRRFSRWAKVDRQNCLFDLWKRDKTTDKKEAGT